LMFPKTKRKKDKKAIEQARKPYSELSGKPTRGEEPHHYLITVGAGGPDHPYNLIQLTWDEHTKAHAGNISEHKLVKIVAEREGVSEKEIIETVYRLKS